MANSIIQKKLCITSTMFDFAIELDRLDTLCKDKDHLSKLNADTQSLFYQRISEITSQHKRIDTDLTEVYENELPYVNYVGSKLDLIQKKYSIGTNPANTGGNIPHSQFVDKALPAQKTGQTFNSPVQVQSPLAKRNLSFNITASSAAQQVSTPSISATLNRMSFLLRNNNEAQALAEFNALPDQVKQSVFAALWTVCGKPMPGHPMAHSNFGEVSFFNQELRCTSSAQQKACAIELIKTQHSMNEIISLLSDNKFEQAKEIFLKLPSQVQGAVYAKHWEVCGKPMPGHPMAHDNFGEVSFLGTVERCNVPCAKKAETLTAYLPQFIQSSNDSQELVSDEIAMWQHIDNSTDIRGLQKTIKKNESIHAFVAKIIRLFLGQNTKIETPDLGSNQAYKALAAAYVEKYPFLKPFLLQLENSLTFRNEKLEELSCVQDNVKSSTPQDLNLHKMSWEEKGKCFVKVMGETLETLNQGYYINSKGKKVTLNLEPSIQSLELVHNADGRQRSNKHNTQLILDNRDCLTVARDCAQRNLNPILLDAASDNAFGGGYKKGSAAQEEHICRVSGLCIAVDPTQGRQKNNFYPLSKNGDTAGLYVSNVPVFRGEQGQGFPYLDEPFETAVAVMAAYNFNFEHQTKNGVKDALKLETGYQGKLRIPQAQIEGTKGKIRTILHMAEKKGHDSVVLIALGCGAFCTPPSHMCDLMMQVIVTDFPNSFKEIHISIIDDHNTGKTHNVRGNYVEFKEMIGHFAEPMKKVGMSFQVT